MGAFSRFYEGSFSRGYFGSYSGANEDIDFGTTIGNTAGSLHLTIKADPKLSIDSTGNIGIGTTIPLYKLDVLTSTELRTLNLLNDYVGNSDRVGVYGVSINNPGYGYGARSYGGYVGLTGTASASVYSGSAYGVWGLAIGSTGGGPRYGVYGNAFVGSTNYGVYCNGSGAYTGTWTLVSDQKFKEEVLHVESALDMINKLNPVSYNLKRKEFPMMNFPEGRQYGFIAQELEKVIPILVEDGAHPGAEKEDPTIELKAVNYTGLIPILTKAILEQQLQIDELKAEIKALKGE